MKITLLFFTILATTLGGFFFINQKPEAAPVGLVMQQPLPTLTPLTPTPRANFRPTTRKGYWNIDVVDDFRLPDSKALIFSAAGRNLYLGNQWDKLFRRGFSAIDQTRMVAGKEVWTDGFPPQGWTSRLKPSQRSLTLYQNYFTQDAFGLGWARNSEQARETWYRRPNRDRQARRSIYQAGTELQGQCVNYGDCPPGGMKNTNGFVIFDMENDGTSANNQQEHANLYVLLAKTVKENAMPYTQLGSITPVPHNSFGYSRTSDYANNGPEWLWNKPAQHTATSRQRGLTDEVLGRSFADYMDLAMPGTYYLYPDFDYTIPHNADDARHWLASLVGEQEVNLALTNKRRMAWQWLFNTQNGDFPNSSKASNPAPPAVAEGMATFYWFTGAYGVLFWDDHNQMTPDQPSPSDPNQQGLGNDRNYACYEHYLHGLWRLFKHHGDLFNGRETYLNQNTECSFDGGQTWYKYNANQLKTRSLPFVRAIVNGDQILVSATMPYSRPNAQTNVLLRYVQNGYRFYSRISLKGDEIYLGRATMPK